MTNTKSTTNSTIKDDGERMIPDFHKSKLLYGEHIVRYLATQPLVKDKVAVDVASGSGYGTAVLGKTAKKVIGIDIDKKAVNYAQKKFGSSNVSFKLGSGTELPLDNDSVDRLVTFETIEHIENYRNFLSEIKRVLRKDGMLILSTPNDIEFPEGNHYHVHEFVEKELVDLLKKQYKYVEMYYQSNWLYTMLSDKSKISTEWDSNVRTIQTANIAPKKAIYFYVLCSDSPIKEKIEPIASASEHYSARLIDETEKSIREFIEEQGRVIKHQQKRIDVLDKELSRIRTKIDRITKSKLGKLVMPIAKKISRKS